MKMIWFTPTFLFLSGIFSFTNKTNRPIDSNIEKWKKAVVHLEIPYEDYSASEMEIIQLFKDDKIDYKEYYQRTFQNKTYKEGRSSGTAIFFKNNNKHYLLTARHVVFDNFSAKNEGIKEEMKIKGLPEIIRNKISELDKSERIKKAEKEGANKIFSRIFRVRSIDEYDINNTNNRVPDILMSLTSEMIPRYTFSDPSVDLAIISLDNGIVKVEPSFSQGLLDNGYVPISLNDIASENPIEGQDLMAVGFPGSTSRLGNFEVSAAEYNWSSNAIAVPVFSFGKVAMQNQKFHFFWSDLSIYPGNSGGPVISNNKLVGIVSAQAVINVEDDKHNAVNLTTRIPFGFIIKTKYIKELITQHDKKEKEYERNSPHVKH